MILAEATDRDVAHFISEHYNLLRWIFRICRLSAQKTTKFYRDEEKAYGDILHKIQEKNLCDDYEGTYNYLKVTLMTLEVTPGIIKVDTWDDIDNVQIGTGGCPFMK